ncbi:MAG TPA: SDR family oxidoreductase [Kofleriaceae bacterium]
MLAGRRGLVLGVSGPDSIGYAIARRCTELGAHVTVACRPARVERVAPLGFDVLPLEVDDEASFARIGALPGLDFLVHGLAGVPEGLLAQPLTDVSRADFEHVLSVAAWSLVAACRHGKPLLAKSSAPRVVALTSICGHRMTPHYHVAGIAKAALESAVLYLAQELGRAGILVNAVGSGLVATEGARRAVGDAAATATRAIQGKRAATGRAVEPDEIADAVAFFASPLARNITGEILTVDGGFSRNYL